MSYWKYLHITIFVFALAGCGSKKSKSPDFDPESIVQIKGQILDPDGEPLSNTKIELRNLRYYAYTEVNSPLPKFFYWMFWKLAFFMFPAYETKNDEVKEQANYFLSDVETDIEGYFDFQIKAGNLLRDELGGININLLNAGDGMQDAYIKHIFVVSEQVSELGSIQQCTLGPFSITEGSDSIDISWQSPATEVTQYVLKIADADNNYLLWTDRFEADTNTVSLAKAIFGTKTLRIALEAYYRNDVSWTSLCLTPSQTFQAQSPVTNLASGAIARSPQIEFDINSLTNDQYNDNSYFDAFDTLDLVLDLSADRTIQGFNLHNLLASKEASSIELTAYCASESDPENFDVVLGRDLSLKRFFAYPLDAPVTCRYVKFRFSQSISQLQEVTIW